MRLALEFLNFRLDPQVQRALSLSYRSSPGRPDITDRPAEFASVRITTEEQMRQLEFPESETIGRRRREWTLTWQEIKGG